MKYIYSTLLALFILTNSNAQCPGLQPFHSIQDESCAGYGNGYISWNPTGGSGNYSYTIAESGSNNLVYQGTNQFYSFLIPGSYYYIIEDITNVCYDTTFFNILGPAPITINSSPTNTTCGSCDGTISVNATGGTPPYAFSWTGPNGYVNTIPNINNLCAGNYFLEVYDANGCVDSVNVVVADSPPPTITLNMTNTMQGNCDGSITTTVSGGAGGYTYSWTGPNSYTSTQQDIFNLCVGNYNLTVIDANGCTAISSANILDSTIVTTFNVFDVMCPNGVDGGIDVYAAGGSGSYQLQITDLSYNVYTTSTASLSYYNLIAGTYYYIVTDLVTSAADTVIFNINEPQPLTFIENIVHDSCGQCTGELSVNVIGGTAPYSYNWSVGATSPTITNLCQGVYYLDVFDVNGCYMQDAYSVNSVGSSIVLNGAITGTDCGLCTGIIDASVTGGTAPYQYSWDDPLSQTTEDISGLCSGNYTLSVTDNIGCTVDSIFYVHDVNNMVVNPTSTNTSCTACDGTATLFVSGGTAPYTYDLQAQNNTTGFFSGLCEGIYTTQVQDANGCIGYTQVFVYHDTISISGYNASITNETTTNAFDGSIEITYDTVANPNILVSWSPANTTGNGIYNLQSGWQTITFTDTVNGGCEVLYEYVGLDQSMVYVSGYIFTDLNGNCVLNTNEPTIANQTVSIVSGSFTYTGITNSQGYYSIMVPSNTFYTVSTTLSATQSTACNNNVGVNVASNNVNSVNIGLNASPFENLCIYNYNFGFVPGFSCINLITVYNTGNISSAGTAYFVIPGMTTFDYASPSPDFTNGDTVFWNVPNLAPNQYYHIQVSVICDASTPLGTYVETCTGVTLMSGGSNANPNCSNYCNWNEVTGSFDPNDKAVLPRGEGSAGNIPVSEDEFEYLIRFQNTGTGPAVNIYITDTLDAMLDRSTLQMMSASHPFEIEYYGNNVIRWRFNNINLPDSGSNEVASHGYISFRINTLNTPQIGESIENEANIYFDFNEPVITNTTLNTFAEFSQVPENVLVGNLTVYPNPANENIHVLTNIKGNKWIQLFDISGKLIESINSNQTNTNIDISNLPAGMYIIKSSNEKESERGTFIKY